MAKRHYGVTADGTHWLILPGGEVVCVICEEPIDRDDPDDYIRMILVGDRDKTAYAVHRPDCAAKVSIACDKEGIRNELLP